MDRTDKKVFLLFILFTFMISLFSLEASAEKKIGILVFSDEVRYNETQQGILDQLTTRPVKKTRRYN